MRIFDRTRRQERPRRRDRRRIGDVQLPAAVRKEDAACCNARRDSDGRLPIGFCSPDCIRRAS